MGRQLGTLAGTQGPVGSQISKVAKGKTAVTSMLIAARFLAPNVNQNTALRALDEFCFGVPVHGEFIVQAAMGV